VYQTLLRDARFFDFLFRCDQDLAREARRGGCPHCGGRLHQADYPRKPRGGTIAISSPQARRLSLCCDRDGCRRRLMPPSLRFLGRRVYLAAVVVLAAAMRQGPNPRRVGALEQLVGVSRRTLRRWQAWWRTIFPQTLFWKAARCRLRRPIQPHDLPRALLERFSADPREQVLGLLRWLGPLTGCG